MPVQLDEVLQQKAIRASPLAYVGLLFKSE